MLRYDLSVTRGKRALSIEHRASHIECGLSLHNNGVLEPEPKLERCDDVPKGLLCVARALRHQHRYPALYDNGMDGQVHGQSILTLPSHLI